MDEWSAKEDAASRDSGFDPASNVTSQTYVDWNDGFARHFFNPGRSGKRVFLFVSKDTIDSIARQLDLPSASFVAAVEIGPRWVTRQGLCQGALQTYDNWRSRGLEYPPYLGYLALFVLAAGLDGGFAPNNYYDRLRTLAGIVGEGHVPSFDRMSQLWEDLQQWSSVDTSGALGVFRATTVGGMVHVGYPISQTILAASELSALPRIFSLAGIDSSSTLSDDELCRILAYYGRSSLRHRTRELIIGNRDREQRDLLTEIVAEELAEWDGKLTQSVDETSQPSVVSGALRLSLAIDSVARRATVRLRCTSPQVLPLEPTELLLEPSGQSVICEQETPQCSAPLRSQEQYVNAADFDWRTNFVAASAAWKFHFRGAAIRLFVDGRLDGVSGYFETFALPTEVQFALAFHQSAERLITTWLSSSCKGLVRLELSGLPPSWSLVLIQEAADAASLANHFPVLGRPKSNRVRFRGGIKASQGSRYYSFALPTVFLADGSEPESIQCNGIKLTQRNDDGSYTMPDEVSLQATTVSVEVQSKEHFDRRTIFLAAPTNWMLQSESTWFDGWYSPLQGNRGDGVYVSGATVVGFQETLHVPQNPLLIEGLDLSKCRRVVLVGDTPGSILDWPVQDIRDLSFHPVWALAFSDGIKVHYCKASLAPNSYVSREGFGRRDVRAWREIIWNRRRVTREPRDATLARLWRAFVRTARDAHAG